MVRSLEVWRLARILALLAPLVGHAVHAHGQAPQPSVLEALRLKPTQPGVDYDVPEDAAAEKCTLNPISSGQMTGWEVRDGAGNVLRRFLDTNKDKMVDHWCYFKDGIEVYRDIDSDFDRNPDQYRWLGTAGIRWGIDTNKDGRLDSWKMISPEELSEEVIAALATRDTARFRRLVLAPEELQSLQLGQEQQEQMAQRIAETLAGFEALAQSQQFVDNSARWVNFGGTRPGVVPAGTDGARQDLHVYENAVAVIESEGLHSQVIVGTLVHVGDGWRVIDLPKSTADAHASLSPGGFFFQASLARRRSGCAGRRWSQPRSAAAHDRDRGDRSPAARVRQSR